MRMSCSLLAVLALVTTLVLSACGGQRVTRMEAGEYRDRSGDWNAHDSRLVADTMIKDSLNRSWYRTFATENGRPPVVQIGHIRVRTEDNTPISTEIFTNDLRRAFINETEGQIVVVASDEELAEMVAARKRQEVHATEETRSRSFAETGADFRIIGSILVQNDRLGREVWKSYSTDLIMTHIESGRQVWMGNHKIDKDVNTGRYR